MNFRQRILLDRLIAIPAAIFLNAAVWVLGRLLRRDHSASVANTKVIVVAKLVGMGSAVQAIPLLRGLHERFPLARIIFLTLLANRGLVMRLPCVQDVICLDDSRVTRMAASTLGALSRLVRLRVDHYLDLEVYSGFAGILAICSLARNRLGFYRHSSKYKRSNYTHLIYFNTRMPVRLLYVQLGRLIGVEPRQDHPSGVAVFEEDHKSLMSALPELATVKKPFVLLNPNASDMLLERRWPSYHVLEAIGRLVRAGVPVVLSGSPGEAEYVKGIEAALPADVRSSVLNSAGRLSFGAFLALLQRTSVIVTNDTGPMHLAIALDRPVICLFGPGSPDHYDVPRRSGVVTLYAAVSCSPCIYEVDVPPCRGDNVCMKRIAPQMVVDRALTLIGGEGASALSSREIPDEPALPVAWEDPESGDPLGAFSRFAIR